MCSAADHTRLDSLLRRSKRLGYCSDDVPVVADLFNTADDDFFHRVKTNSDHVLQPYLPYQTNIPMKNLPWKGRGQGHVSNFYIVDLGNFATASGR